MELLRRLNNPQNRLKIIHVAGTNGKGSTSAFLSAILAAAGYRVGRYISPAVFSYRERIQIMTLLPSGKLGSEYITKKGVCETVEMLKPVCEAMQREGFAPPTSFELETAMAMLYLYAEQVDFVVLEVGMGGRLDATNVINAPLCSVITSISMDHMQFLGDSIDKIAYEKAGIIKQGSNVVTCNQEEAAQQVIRTVCHKKQANLTIADKNNITNIQFSPERTSFTVNSNGADQQYSIRLLGEYQLENAYLALETAKILSSLGIPIHEEAIKEGLALAEWRGRFEVLSRKPYFIIDGAHNESAAKSLRNSIQLYFTNRRIIFIIGILADKDYKSILELTVPLCNAVITLTPLNPRALSGEILAKEAKRLCGQVFHAEDVSKAVATAYGMANDEDVIIAFGSFTFMGDLIRVLEVRKEGEHYD